MLILEIKKMCLSEKALKNISNEKNCQTVPDTWINHSKTKVSYENYMTKYFYEFKSLHSLEEIQQDIMKLEEETERLIQTVIK